MNIQYPSRTFPGRKMIQTNIVEKIQIPISFKTLFFAYYDIITKNTLGPDSPYIIEHTIVQRRSELHAE
jgi:hypothetical protein